MKHSDWHTERLILHPAASYDCNNLVHSQNTNKCINTTLQRLGVCGLTLPVLLGDWDFVSSRLQVVGFDHAHFLLEYLRHTGGVRGVRFNVYLHSLG